MDIYFHFSSTTIRQAEAEDLFGLNFSMYREMNSIRKSGIKAIEHYGIKALAKNIESSEINRTIRDFIKTIKYDKHQNLNVCLFLIFYKKNDHSVLIEPSTLSLISSYGFSVEIEIKE